MVIHKITIVFWALNTYVQNIYILMYTIYIITIHGKFNDI